MSSTVPNIPRTTVAEGEALLKEFLDRHPEASIIDSGGHALVSNPWGDASVSFYIPMFNPRRQKFVDALNNVQLPNQLSAIYHIDTLTLEVLWTAYKLPDHLQEIIDREFTFDFGGTKHKCSFASSSDRILKIAEEAILNTYSTSNHRSLRSFELFVNPDRESSTDFEDETPSGSSDLDRPISFFVDNLAYADEDELISKLRHLNFYLRYFDSQSPIIAIHEIGESTEYSKRCRYIDGSFPPAIPAKNLNPILINFWLAASSGDSSRRFLHYFRIIEYVSFYYLEAQAKRKISLLMAMPNPSANNSYITEKAIEIFRDAKADEYQRFKSVVTELVSERHIEREALQNKKFFLNDHEFDGGFKIKPFLTGTDKPTIGPHGMDTFVTMIRDIRNALSHGRDQKSGQVIMPTSRNLNDLKPWVELIATAAAEVVLYEAVA